MKKIIILLMSIILTALFFSTVIYFASSNEKSLDDISCSAELISDKVIEPDIRLIMHATVNLLSRKGNIHILRATGSITANDKKYALDRILYFSFTPLVNQDGKYNEVVYTKNLKTAADSVPEPLLNNFFETSNSLGYMVSVNQVEDGLIFIDKLPSPFMLCAEL